MDLKKLAGFRAVAKHGNLRRAAAEQNLTLAAISIQIKKLEDELGTKLFDRRLNRLVLTAKGRSFLQDINLAFEALERAKFFLSKEADGFDGSISIALAADIIKFFAPTIATFIMRHPKLKVEILARPSRESMSLVLSGGIDIGIGFYRRVPSGITKRTIWETAFALVVPNGHALAKLSHPSLCDIAEHRVVMPPRSTQTGRMIDAIYSSQGINLTNIVEVERCQSTMDLVALGLGVGLVHHVCSCAATHSNLHHKDLSGYFGKTDIAFIMRSTTAFNPARDAFVEALVEGGISTIRKSQV